MFLYVQVDGRDVMGLETGKEAAAWLAPGEHHLHIRAWNAAMSSWAPYEKDISFEPGAHHDLSIRCTPGGWFQKNTIGVFERPWCDRLRTPQASANIGRGLDWTAYTFEVEEQGLQQEPFGTSSYIEDNLQSSVSANRTNSIENEWIRTITFGSDRTQTRAVSAALGIDSFSLETRLETTVSNRYSIQRGERQKVSQQVDVEVPPHTRLEVFISWKLIWQTGIIRISGQDKTVEVPFKFVHSLDFDRSSISK
jgi:hypothetical protein